MPRIARTALQEAGRRPLPSPDERSIMQRSWLPILAALTLQACGVAGKSSEDTLDSHLAMISAIGVEGAGNAEAAKAWHSVVDRGPNALLPALAAFDDTNPRAANWLRAAVDAIADEALARGQPLDAKALE